jgi:hypothetical protein
MGDTCHMAAPEPEMFSIDAFLADEGFSAEEARSVARGALEAAGLTRAGKTGMASTKLPRARAELRGRLIRVCTQDACRTAAAVDPRIPVSAARERCDICAGSNNQVAMRRMADACRIAGMRHLLIVGGRPSAHEQLSAELLQRGLHLRFVDGTQRAPSQKQAWVDCDWADLVVVWAPTPLPHKVSDRYARDVCDADRVEVHRRGIEALAHEVIRHLTGS